MATRFSSIVPFFYSFMAMFFFLFVLQIAFVRCRVVVVARVSCFKKCGFTMSAFA